MSNNVFSVFVETRVNYNIVKLQVRGPRIAYIFLPCMDFCLAFEEAEEEDEDAVDFRPLRRLLVRERFRDFFAFNFSTYPPRCIVFLR